jgi:hypothetical protein
LAVVDVFKNWSHLTKLQETSKDFKKLQKTSKNFKGNFKCFLQNFKDFFVAFSKLQIVDWRFLQCPHTIILAQTGPPNMLIHLQAGGRARFPAGQA